MSTAVHTTNWKAQHPFHKVFISQAKNFLVLDLSILSSAVLNICSNNVPAVHNALGVQVTRCRKLHQMAVVVQEYRGKLLPTLLLALQHCASLTTPVNIHTGIHGTNI
jgi:hypothetical protein